jgi:ABC-type transport system involved in cytochrome c biogenesis permease subunit
MMRCFLGLLFALQAAFAIDLSPLEQIPVQEGGRKKPFLVFAEESLLGLTGKTAVKIGDRKMRATELVTTLWLNPLGWDNKPIILVNHKPLKEATGMDTSRKLFSYQELTSNRELVRLLNDAQVMRARPGSQKLAGLPKEAAEVGLRIAEFESLVNGSAFRLLANPRAADAQWLSVPGTSDALKGLRGAFVANDAAAFTREAEALRREWAGNEPQFQPASWKIELETLYQKAHPFRWAWMCYAAAGILLLLSELRRAGYAAAWILAGIGFLLQVAGFAARVAIAGRPPVTNMYESVVWVAFGTILFALVFEAIYRSRYFLLGAVPVAVASLILADTQTLALDRSINPLVPVLRDNFWLTTHVLTITLSYAAFALALGIGHIALAKIIRGRKPDTVLYDCLYRALQVGVLLLATGTILGGVWANYSWGRFWDWDPKETWALITLLGYLFVLHGRIAGKWGGFGMAVGAVLAFQGVLMAWYGVNFVLGVGLHSYGFGTGGLGWASLFVAAEIGFVLLAVVRKAQSDRFFSTPAGNLQAPTPVVGKR